MRLKNGVEVECTDCAHLRVGRQDFPCSQCIYLPRHPSEDTSGTVEMFEPSVLFQEKYNQLLAAHIRVEKFINEHKMTLWALAEQASAADVELYDLVEEIEYQRQIERLQNEQEGEKTSL